MRFASYYKVIVVLLILKIKNIYGKDNLYTSNANNSYYINFNEKFNWIESHIACLDMNMILLEVDRSEKSLEVKTLIRDVQRENNLKDVNLWIGGTTSVHPNKQFIWFATGKEFTYTNWAANTPDKHEFCVEMRMDTNLKWHDQDCLSNSGYVCEHSSQQTLNNLKGTVKQETQHNPQRDIDVERQKVQLQQELSKREQFVGNLKWQLKKRYNLKQEYQNHQKELNRLPVWFPRRMKL